MVTITIKPEPDIPNLIIITITGSIDPVTSKQVNEKVFSVIKQEESNIIVDLSKVHYISSSGMMNLFNYLQLMTDKKRLCKFVKLPEYVQNSLEASGIAGRLEMYDSIEAAISSF
jgi:anti-anti-sigma factor